MKSVTAEKVTTLEEQREGEVVAEEEVVKVEVEKNLGEPAEQREGELVKEEVRGGGEEKLQKLFCPPSYRSGFEKLGKMAKKCAVSIDLGSTYSCVGSFPAWKGLNAYKKNPK